MDNINNDNDVFRIDSISGDDNTAVKNDPINANGIGSYEKTKSILST